MATISECRYRGLRVPATTFVILTHRPGVTAGTDPACLRNLGPGDGQVRLRAALPGQVDVRSQKSYSLAHSQPKSGAPGFM